MMQDLAMHLLEIIMNSISAGAKRIGITFLESTKDNTIEMGVQDDGKGMSQEMVERVTNPFTTGRKTRNVGLGVAFMYGLCEQCNGSFHVESELGKGTTVRAIVERNHIDLPPRGNLGEMMMACLQANEDIDYRFVYKIDDNEFTFDTIEVKEQLDGVPIREPEILLWLRDYINEGIEAIRKETL